MEHVQTNGSVTTALELPLLGLCTPATSILVIEKSQSEPECLERVMDLSGGTEQRIGLTIAASVRGGDGGMPIRTPKVTLRPAEDDYFFGCT